MKYIYWFLKAGIFYSFYFPAQYLFNFYGWWPVVAGMLVWLTIDGKLNKKLDKIKERELF
ncbi:hypothetical protein B0H99_10127 [Planomicrobium soli]|uniref:Uncharacterized protein n=1 Tax=Planomicrobium soli TaxID=1176648 RepID=A0A2P8H6H3_9BACL|nr:hypothetical protein [Planomicrobium soli]PSL41784.1 hypothetical protein B0H99_10127 [Planomicrobium soli]